MISRSATLDQAVPTDATYVGAIVDRAKLIGAARVAVDLSADGVSWVPLGAIETDAKEVRTKQGNVITETVARFRLPRSRVGRPQRVRVRCDGVRPSAVSLLFDDAAVPEPPKREHNSVTYDNDAEGTVEGASSLTLSNFAVGDNANRAMTVGVASWDDTGANTVSGVTLGGSATGWSELIEEQDAGDNAVAIWGCVAPAVGTADVVVTMSDVVSELGVNALSVHDAHQSATFGTPNDATGSSSTPSVVISAAADGMVYDIVYCNTNAGCTAGDGQTERCDSAINAGGRVLASTEPGAASVTMSWTLPSAGFWIQAGVAINVADATPTAAITGTAGDGATEAQIVAGGQTLIITVAGDTWIPA